MNDNLLLQITKECLLFQDGAFQPWGLLCCQELLGAENFVINSNVT